MCKLSKCVFVSDVGVGDERSLEYMGRKATGPSIRLVWAVAFTVTVKGVSVSGLDPAWLCEKNASGTQSIIEFPTDVIVRVLHQL